MSLWFWSVFGNFPITIGKKDIAMDELYCDFIEELIDAIPEVERSWYVTKYSMLKNAIRHYSEQPVD